MDFSAVDSSVQLEVQEVQSEEGSKYAGTNFFPPYHSIMLQDGVVMYSPNFFVPMLLMHGFLNLSVQIGIIKHNLGFVVGLCCMSWSLSL